MPHWKQMAGLVRRKTGGMVKAVEEWFEPFKIPEDPNKPFLQRYREHVNSIKINRNEPEFQLKSVKCTTRSLRFLMAFQAPTMLYVYITYIVPHTLEEYSLWTQFYGKLLCWLILFNGLSNYLLVIFTDASTLKLKNLLNSEMIRISQSDKNILTENQFSNQTNDGASITDKTNGHCVYEIGETKEALSWDFCTKCNISMPPRSHHCKYCDVCILKRDHHCNMVGNCVGFNNQRFFIVLTFYAMITGLLGAFFTLKYIYEAEWPTMYSWTDLVLPITLLRYLFGSIPPLQTLLILHCYLEIPFGAFGVMYFFAQMLHVMMGLTPHEVEKNLPLKSIHGPGYNLRYVFGKYWALNFVFPMFIFFKELDNGIHYEHIKIDHEANKKAKSTTKESLEQTN